MITLTVTRRNGEPVSGPRVDFDELGGTIGRAPENRLVLEDASLTVSRFHARIVFRGDTYAIIDQGSNPVLHNGQPLGQGREARLSHGDSLQFGGYCLAVTCPGSAGHAYTPPGPAVGSMSTPMPGVGSPVFSDPAATLRPDLPPLPGTVPPQGPTSHRGLQASQSAGPRRREPIGKLFRLPPPAAPQQWSSENPGQDGMADGPEHGTLGAGVGHWADSPDDAATPEALPETLHMPSASNESPAQPAPVLDQDAWTSAFLEGLQMQPQAVAPMTREHVKLMGQLLREAAQGIVELLIARAALKREMRADMTVIAATDNNPLKFSPNVDVALQHLLGSPVQGFMSPQEAMRDAVHDLRANQLALIAGMRAALHGMLQRLDPQAFEERLGSGTALSELVPGGRKARKWELYEKVFAVLADEANDNFDELFGKAFVLEYQAQIDRLRKGG